MRVGNIILSENPSLWEISDMTEEKTLRGRALYEALMAHKPEGLAETDWAQRAGVNRGFFSNLKSSETLSPRTDNLQKVMRFAGISEAHLYGGKPRPQIETVFSMNLIEGDRAGVVHVPGDGEVVQIQKLDLSLSMGPGTLIDGYVESEIVNFDLSFVRLYTRATSDHLRLVTGIGDSMEPTLRWGDLVMIDTSDRLLSRQDGIYWISLYGAAGLKRLRAIGPSRVLVKSDNPNHDDQEVDATDLRIEGRAVWATRGL